MGSRLHIYHNKENDFEQNMIHMYGCIIIVTRTLKYKYNYYYNMQDACILHAYIYTIYIHAFIA